MFSANMMNQCGNRNLNISQGRVMYRLECLPRDWDARSNILRKEICLRSNQRWQLLDLAWQHCTKQKMINLGDIIRVLLTVKKKSVCGRDAQI